MSDALQSICDRLDGFAESLGRGVAWGVVAMALIVFAQVLARHVFGVGSLWLQESVAYLHAAVVLFAAAWTLQAGGHVRVDIFYADAAPRTRAWIDLIGALGLLVPFAVLLMWAALPYARRAWAILEGSRETGGLPLLFLFKTMIVLFAAHLFAQGVAQALRAGLLLVQMRVPTERS